MAETQTTSFKAPATPKTNGHIPSEEQKAQTAIEPETPEFTPMPSRNAWLKPLLFTGGAVLVLLAVIFGMRYWRFSSNHVSTDDAALTSDVVQISPQVGGTVSQVLVQDNQVVNAGDLLASLDDATYRATVDQRKADLDAAVAQAKGAGYSVSLTRETGSAQVRQAQGPVSQAEGGIAGANADVARTEAGISNARATAKSAEANVGSALAGVQASIASKQRYADAVVSAQAAVETAKAGVLAAQAALESAQAASNRAGRDSQRYASLVAEGAVSGQTADQANATAASAKAQVENARQQVAGAEATVAQRQADLNAARQQLQWSDAGIAQARAQEAGAREQANAASAGIKQAQAAKRVAEQSVLQEKARREQAIGQLTQAQTAPRQVEVSQSAESQAAAKIEQARAALKAAQLQLNYTKIYAPLSGRVSKKTAEVGALVQPGTPLMAVIPQSNIWVVANFKETQLAGVRPGARAEIEVDAIPGRSFRGRVESLSAGTGSTFALLPPDNATGNFTKVVQRVPVKITLEPGQSDLDRLRAGMSVTAIVQTK